MGYLIHKKKINSFLPSIIALIILYFFIYLGTIYEIDLTSLGFSNPQNTWIIFLFIYSGIASILPVWILLQPRDYINSHQLLVGLGLIYLSIFIFKPEITAPALNITSDAPPMIPFLFVTIACGAISGFHGLVSSGTTSKQVDKISDTRLIGYGSMIGEGALALAAIIASIAGIALVTNCNINGIYHDQLTWHSYYDTWEHAAKNKFMAFVLGGAALIEKLGLSIELAKTLISVLIISFAATTLDTATRIQRMIITEFGTALNVPLIKNKIGATMLGIIPAYLLTLNGTGWKLWPVFGASNQMLAGLTLMVITLYFLKRKNNILPLIIPMFFIIIITFISLILKIKSFFIEKNIILLGITSLMLGLIIWMLIEGILSIKNKNA